VRRWLARLLKRECEHRWSGWWVHGDVATSECLFCSTKQTELLAEPRPFQPLSRAGRVLIDLPPIPSQRRPSMKEIIVRAVVTAVEAVLAVLVAAGTTNLNVETGEAALLAGVAALISAGYNAARQWLEAQPSTG
jgi:hypothetical protein